MGDFIGWKEEEIIIVDDNEGNLLFLSNILTNEGYIVRPYQSGELALGSIKAKQPSLILLDVGLPDLDGYEVCRQLKDDKNSHDIPVIFISELDDESSKVTGFQAGGIDFISKPFRKEEVLARVKNHLELYRLQRELMVKNQLLEAEIKNRIEAQNLLKESEERYRTTLYSIGDGVITTDVNGIIRLINPVAEQLTGWTQVEASGKSLEEVFQIINEETRNQVEIPVRRVIREGVTVGLANHTLLIAKDGAERPIADSGAPIRNEKGEIVGVVMVFRDQTEDRKAEKALKQNEIKYRYLFDNNPLPMWIADPVTLAFLNVNEAAIIHYGYSREEFLSMTLKEIRPKEDIPELLTVVSNSHGRFDKFGVHKHKKKNGDLIFVEIISHEIEYEGRIARLVLSSDVHERMKAERELKESEERFQMLFNKAPLGYQSLDFEGCFIEVNQKWLDTLGYKRDEVIGKWFGNFLSPDFQDGFRKRFPIFKAQGHIHSEFEMVHKNGEKLFIAFDGKIGYDSKGDFKQTHCILQDITEKRRAENALKESEEKFRKLAESTPIAICIYQDNHWVYANRAIEELSGYSLEEYSHLQIWDFVAPEYQDMIKAKALERLVGKGSSEGYEFQIIRKDGQSRWVYLKGSQITYNGRPAGLISVLDITQNKKTEEIIIKERTLLRTLIDNLPNTVYVKDLEGRKLIANKADIDFIGSSFNEVIGKTDKEVYEGELGQHGLDDDMRVMQTGESMLNVEESFYDNKGEKRWLITSKIPLRDSSGKVYGLVGTGRDITGQHRDHETIQKLTKSIEQSPSSIVITDIMGNIEYVNPKFSEITGYSLEEAIGKNPRILKSGEMTHEKYKELWDIISSGGVWRGEFHNRKKNGELYWEWATITSIKNDKDKITNYIAIKEDINTRKQMEVDLILAKERAEESDRLKSAFLANMSHEIRTPLNSIIGFSELLNDDDFEPEQKKDFIQHIVRNGNNLLNIISDIVDISKIEAGQIIIRKGSVPTNKFLGELMAQHVMKIEEKRIEFRTCCLFSESEKEVFVLADKERLHQIFNNLISNALKFTSEGFIEIGYKPLGDMVEFHVKDTGIGISPVFYDKIFERFRQVEAEKTRKYGGNGLGLSITKNLVELMGGKIWLESEEGKGSTFYFTLPAIY